MGDRVEADISAVVATPISTSEGPRCIEVPFFLALGNGEHAWQRLERTCSVGAGRLPTEGEQR